VQFAHKMGAAVSGGLVVWWYKNSNVETQVQILVPTPATARWELW
jgi:hypothetical protein